MSANLFDLFQVNFDHSKIEYMELEEYLELCKTDHMAYASSAERMLAAIGEPEVVDTSADPRLSRIFMNRTVKIYPAFRDFFGMEEPIERVVSYFRHAAQGLEERKQILYLLGPVGGGKSSIAERLKELMEVHPIYVLCAGEETSPVHETPLGLFPAIKYADLMGEKYGIDQRYLNTILSPWAVKRLKQVNGDIRKFRVAKMFPSKLEQIAITKTEPGDDNNQDISCLVGKTDIRKLEHFSQNDPDSYAFSGALCRSNQGLLEFTEMFKAPIKVLHPLLTATQEGNYVGTEAISAIPFNGSILAHCFSDDTELLTKDGWRTHDQIEIGDLLATMNRDIGDMEYQPALRKFEQEYKGPMYHFHNGHVGDHLVTPNHKMLIKKSRGWDLITASEATNVVMEVPLAATYTRQDSAYYADDNELMLHVWCMTDGNQYIYSDGREAARWTFRFSKERKIRRLTTLLQDMSIPFDLVKYDDGVTKISVKNLPLKYTKQLTDDARLLSAHQTRVLVTEWAQTDGAFGSPTSLILSTTTRKHADIIQELCTISGHKCGYSVQEKGGDWADEYRICIRLGKAAIQSKNLNSGVVDYEGKVFCFETANHTLVARRNGRVIITGNSNESEWQTFRNNKNNEAFLDRICVIKVPYCLRTTEEQEIYAKMIGSSDLKKAPMAPETLRLLARFSVLSRLKEHANSNSWSKMRVYNGENIKETDPKAKSLQEYRDDAGVDEGMNGISTRFAFKILSQAFNHDGGEVAADPVHVMMVLEQSIRREQFPKDVEAKYLSYIKDYLVPEYAEFVGNEIQTAYLEAYDEYGQNLFDRYVDYADSWISEVEHKDPDTGTLMNRELINNELEKIEKAAGIANPKDFRHEVVNFVLRKRARDHSNVDWKSYEKLKKVIEKKMFSSVEELLPVISFGTKQDKDTEQKHKNFVSRMTENGYTPRQVRRIVEWYMRAKKS